MTERSVVHDIFTLERVFDAAPEQVFTAFADKSAKEQWFGGPPEWGTGEHVMDFRVGGIETSRGGPKEGPEHFMDGRYHEIVPNARIVFTYDMWVGDVQLSTSLQTIEFRGKGSGTQLVFTEQGVYYDGHEDPAQRQEGMNGLLDAVVAAVDG
jgi:uncharacterized protein YndB with AHSA1/START domain